MRPSDVMHYLECARLSSMVEPVDPRDAATEAELTRAGRASNAIYGLIVASAVLAVAPRDTVARLAWSVLVTLLTYWAAERYAAVLALRIITKRSLTRAELRVELSHGWELVTASFVPILVLVVAYAMGAGISGAVVTALASSTALLCFIGWRVAGEARMGVRQRLLTAAMAGAFGVLMILLKAQLHH
jgi:hypothetical protein